MLALLASTLLATSPLSVVEAGCQQESTLLSPGGGQPGRLRVFNASPHTVKVFFRDWDGGRKLDLVIAPGEGAAQNVSQGEFFTVTDLSLTCLGVFAAGDGLSEVMVLPDRLSARTPDTWAAFEAAGEATYEGLQLAGFTVYVNRATHTEPALRTRALRLLETKLAEGRALVAARHPAVLTQAILFVELLQLPSNTLNYVLHPEAPGWSPKKHKAIVVNDLAGFVEIVEGRMPMTLVHELAHRVFDLDLEALRPAVEAAWRAAVARATDRDSYDLKNADEYFAERTEAWFGANDLPPHDRASLEREDPLAAVLMARIWGDGPVARK